MWNLLYKFYQYWQRRSKWNMATDKIFNSVNSMNSPNHYSQQEKKQTDQKMFGIVFTRWHNFIVFIMSMMIHCSQFSVPGMIHGYVRTRKKRERIQWSLLKWINLEFLLIGRLQRSECVQSVLEQNRLR